MDHGTGGWALHQAQRRPTHLAFVDVETGTRTTYREFERLSADAAAVLAVHGVAAGDRVALLLPNGTAFLVALFAAWRLGAIAVPVNLRLSDDEISALLPDCDPRVVVVDPDSPHPMARGRDWPAEVLVLAGDHGIRAPEDVPSADVDLGDPCLIMYTSGTTGRPKGAVLTHGNVLANAVHGIAMADGMSSTDISLTAAPLFHVGALGIHCLPLFYAGGTNLLMSRFDAPAWVEAVPRWGVTLAFAVPTMWDRICRAAGTVPHDFATLRNVMVGGSPADARLLTDMAALGLDPRVGYGLTETSPIVSYMGPGDHATRPQTVGRPAHLVDIRVVGDDGRERLPGEAGHVEVAGPNVFVGYWNDPPSAHAPLSTGWFRTGDIGSVDSSGCLTISGRSEERIITGGENVDATEVETTLRQHPMIADAAALGVEDATWGEAVVALVVANDAPSVDRAEIIQWTRSRLAHFKCPQRIVVVDRLPYTASGKLRRSSLPALMAQVEDDAVAASSGT